ncbi:NADPH-dependent diflavin oxidoreductase 1 [Apophysomyces sp. BC1034]|nr:NADPH-dependent diflavin oxidoreductase 1 [Apophysomyces sp. BC1015]KAG0167657.1 NADPH-dependent diflavin oxidoreductase 1 [Apophysomyces sp. BC1021]KAG0183917.1 NADPH-dependent diflavin oxidoreductase 1 [Apophysomyces sp. BC1034]
MSNRPLLILYGSETGCAQDVAETIGRQGWRRHFRTRVIAMDDYDKAELVEESLVIFVCSTTGKGEEPYNMKKLWRFLLRKNLPPGILNHLNCAVFGLGDSSYVKFNFPAKKLHKRLQQLGANMLCHRGDGDDQHYQGLDGALIPWLENLWDRIMTKYPLPDGMKPIADDSDICKFISGEVALNGESTYMPGEFDAVVKSNDRITATDHFQDVRHFVLSNESGDLAYNPGDVAVITPQNLPEDVDAFLEQMEWTHLADKHIRILPANDGRKLSPRWPAVMTFRELFIHHLDVFGVPRRSFFEMLAFFTNDGNHVERLREFTTPEGQDDMLAYCQRPRRTIAEVLFDFKPCVIPLNYVLDLFPALQPRSFSIASSLKAHKNEIHLCIAIVKYKTKMRKIRRGVCTKWLATLQPGDLIRRMHIVKGTMSLPPPEVPLIAIGPGTGVAPMRSFLEERVLDHATGTYESEVNGLNGLCIGNVLLFGCRYQMKDYIYKDQWENYADERRLTVFTAFSRDQDEKLYVQDRIREHSAFLWNLIDMEGAKVLLSGSAGKMPDQVAYAFKQIFMKEGGLDADQAENYFSTMVKTGQYQDECWS